MPQLTRLFIPSLNTLPENFTTTSLSVDDLVKICYEAGYVKAESNGAPNTNASGSLTMTVQPTATGAANTRLSPLHGERGSMMPPICPSEVELSRALLEALSKYQIDGGKVVR